MTALVPVTAVTPQSDFTGLQFSRSKTGLVHSCWWSYDWRKYDARSPYTIGSYFHSLRSQSMSAFASALGLRERDVFCSQRENAETGQLEWRIGTIEPCKLPVPKLTRAEKSDPLAIDI